MTNEDLERTVSDELSWDPKIDSEAIVVSAQDGIVTLRGSVGSFRQKREAKKAAERVWGVIFVNNDLDVEIMSEERREDAYLRGDVLHALMLDSIVPTNIDATVQDGFVTLTGSVDWQHQRDEATFVAGNVPGVTGVGDQILLNKPTPSAGDVRHAIKKAFERSAKLDAEDLVVATSSGTVTLTGTVHSWSERDAGSRPLGQRPASPPCATASSSPTDPNTGGVFPCPSQRRCSYAGSWRSRSASSR